nr:MAG TPA: hypothetical protein [Caudoviricetes sp.]
MAQGRILALEYEQTQSGFRLIGLIFMTRCLDAKRSLIT